MDEVDFMENNEFHIKSRKLLGEPETPSMVRVLLKSGLVKTEKQALVVLVAAVFLIFAVAWFVFSNIGIEEADYVVGSDGVKYSVEEFFKLVGEGKILNN